MDAVRAQLQEGPSDAGEDPKRPALPFRVALEAMRPRQWSKNLLLFAGLLFTANLFKPDLLLRALAAFFLFCLLSSAVYLVNDVVDQEHDRAHPRKKGRPVASGRLGASTALRLAAALGMAALAISFALRPVFGLLALGFVALNMAYVLWLRREVILDVFCIASGFIIRALAGAVVIAVHISPWLLVCTSLLALALGFGKRRQELSTLLNAPLHRPALEHYSAGLLDQLMGISIAATIGSYCLYSFQSDTAQRHPGIAATIPFVLYGLFRYLYLVHEKGMGGAPEDLILNDRPLQIAVVGWAMVAAFAMVWR